MWTAIFWFEVRYQLRQPLFSLVTLFLAVLLFLAGTGHNPGAALGRLHLNAPAVIFELLVKGVFLVLFLMTAFVASAAVRDFDHRTSELFFSLPISRFDYLTGRFAGTMVVCVLPYLVGAGALAASVFMPWLDPARLGPFRLAPYAFGLGVLIIPTLLALGAAFYALASWTRSTLATYLGVVAFFAVSTTAGMAASHLGSAWIGQLLDPFGVVALAGALEHWTLAELNTAIPDIGGTLLWNRLLWLALGLSALGLTVATVDPTRPRKRPSRTPEATPAPSLLAPASRVETIATSREPPPATSQRFRGHPVLTRVLVQFLHLLRREAANAMGNLAFLGLLALGLFVLLQAASSAGDLFGMPVHPRTYLMLEALQGGYSIDLLLVVVLYSGELIWKERALRLHEILDSLPTPTGAAFTAKLTALVLMMAVFLSAGVFALVGFQLSRGHADLELGLYLRGAALAAVYPLLMLVLACFCHVVAPNRIAGYGLVILFILTWDLLEELGFENHLYRFASLPPTPWSDFNGYGPFLAPFAWTALYWGFAALVLIGLSLLFWRRGTDDTWTARRAVARARFRGPARGLTALGSLGLLAVGAWIFYNTNVLNAYVPSPEAAERRASYERLYRQFQDLDLPRIVAVRADVDLFPERRSATLRGTYRLRNPSDHPLRDLHLSLPELVHLHRLDLPAHDVVLTDTAHGYRIYRLRHPLEPGESIDLGFELGVENPGFVNHAAATAVLDNGSFFTKRDVLPVIGYDPHRQLTDPEERRRRGLEPLVRLADRNDLTARRHTPRAPDADRIDFASTVSTSSDQIAVTSGALQQEWVAGGRRYFHYRAEIPITHHVAWASARYAVTRSEWRPSAGSEDVVAIEVYHHPAHHTNVGRMIAAARKSLAYGTANFGPYQHRSLRIVEFPRYARDATSFPGLISLSESLGFNARLDGSEAIDFPFYVTAHETAHQWWGQQVVGANVQGVGTLHETLAQYSALMVMEDELGSSGIRRVLAFEHNEYLRGRAREREVEAPLALAEHQNYVYYHRGALAMYALRDAVGEVLLNQALSRFLSRFGSGEPPYPTTAELLVDLAPTLAEGSEPLVADLFESLTTYSAKVTAATSTARADGTFLVHLEIEAHKLRGDGAGAEREVALDDWIDIAFFGDGRPEDGADGAENGVDGGPENGVGGGGVERATTAEQPQAAQRARQTEAIVSLERRRLRSSPATFEIVLDQRPVRVVIDPFYKLIDRHRGDNARVVSPPDGQTDS